jgi:trans-aconitate 2-methyltransferase
MPDDTWNPQQYELFRDERSRPFFDLAAMVQPRPGMRVLDLGCGSGRLTAWLHETLRAAETLGIDSSPSMMGETAEHAGNGLRFEEAEIATFEADQPFDLVFSNAALQWLPDHEVLVPRIAGWLAPGGQLAVQMPANFSHPSHRTAAELAQTPPFAEALDGWVRHDPVLGPEQYAVLLSEAGLRGPDEPPSPLVRLQVYLHELPTALHVLEWVKGSLLTAYERRMPPALFPEFLAQYEARLRIELGDESPYLYPFRRLLFWARRPRDGDLA